MAKVDKKKKQQQSLSCNATSKFAVLDAPGVTQPKEEEAVVAAAQQKAGAQGRRAKAGTGPKITTSKSSLGGDCFTHRQAHPAWIAQRAAIYETIQQRRQQEAAQLKSIPITVTLPDGTCLSSSSKDNTPFLSYKTTPYHVAAGISQGLADSATVARVTYSAFCPDYSLQADGMAGADTLMVDDMPEDGGMEISDDNNNRTFLWDMTRPLVGSVSKLEFLKFDADADAKTVFWHSSAHMMGEALEHLFGNKLTIGPPLAGGFYYDSYMGTGDSLRDDDCMS